MNNHLLTAALEYSARGWYVFPIVPRDKKPLTKHGFLDASLSPDQIQSWWTQWPTANVGIRTGKESGIVVLDVDPRNHGSESLEDLEEKHGKLPDTIESQTGGGGRHIFFKHPCSEIKCSASTLGPGLDIKADGGYIVAPPSKHESGKPYVWEGSSGPDDVELKAMPNWLLALVQEHTNKKCEAKQDANTKIREGHRNTRLTSMAGAMQRKGFSEQSILTALQVENVGKCDPPLGTAEIELIAKNITRYEPAHPPESPESPDIWEQPTPLDLIEHPKTLPAASMPSCLYEICSHLGKVMKVPIELPYNLALSIVATTIGNLAEAVFPTHKEPAPYWGMTIMESGTRKSPTFKALITPLLVAERSLQTAWKENHRTWFCQKEIAEARIRDAKNTKRKKGENHYALVNDMRSDREIIENEPIEPHLWTQDSTPQSLAKLICENKSLGLFSPEGGSIFDGLGQYSNSRGADIGIWLSGHAGDAIKYTRVSGKHYSADKALLSVGVTLQSEAFQTLARDEMLVRRGFLARFAIFFPPDPRGKQFYEANNCLEEYVETLWRSKLDNILEIKKRVSETQNVELEDSANRLFLDFGNEIQARMSGTGDLGPIAAWASKLPGLTGRIALSYHFLQDDPLTKRISLETYQQAVLAARKMIEHYKCTLKLGGSDTKTATAKMILNQIKEKGLQEVTASFVSKNGWGGCKNVEEAKRVFKFLADNGYVHAQKNKNAARYFVNPLFLSGKSDESGGQ